MSFPKELNLGSNKPIAATGKPSINRYRADNTSYLNNDTIQIEIPTGRQGQYIFPKTAFIEGSVAVSLSNNGTTISGSVYIDQSVYSLFNRIIVKQGGTVLEDCLYVNKVWTSVMDAQINESERRGLGVSHLIGETATAYGTGYKLATTTVSGTLDNTSTGNNVFYDFAFPLPSAVMGTLASKALPVGEANAGSIYILLELASPSVALVSDYGANYTIALNKFEVKNIYYNVKSTTLPSDVNSALLETTGGSILLPSIAYKAETKSIASGVSSFNDKFSFQFASIKIFYFFFQNAACAAGNVQYRSVSARPKCYVSDYFLQINGEAYPSQAISTYSRMYSELMRSFDQLTDTNAGGIINYVNYTSNTHNVGSAQLTTAAASDFGTQTIQQRFLAGIDLDRFNHSSEVLMSGTMTTGQLINLIMNFSASTSDALTLYAFVMYDILYTIEGGQIKVRQ